MKIVHIITRLIIGGAQENTLISCEGQHDNGHDVTLMTGPAIGPEGTLLERAQQYGYKVEIIDKMRRSILPLLHQSVASAILPEHHFASDALPASSSVSSVQPPSGGMRPLEKRRPRSFVL